MLLGIKTDLTLSSMDYEAKAMDPNVKGVVLSVLEAWGTAPKKIATTSPQVTMNPRNIG